MLDVLGHIGHFGADDDLQVRQAAAVVEFDKRKALLRVATRAHPARDFQRLPGLSTLEDFDNAGQRHSVNRVKPGHRSASLRRQRQL